MKQNIHPKYGTTSIHCACGNVIETRSTNEGVIQVEICSLCHPFFTGKQRIMDTAGRIDRFKKKFGDKVMHAPKKTVTPPPVSKKEKEKKAAEAAAETAPKAAAESKE